MIHRSRRSSLPQLWLGLDYLISDVQPDKCTECIVAPQSVAKSNTAAAQIWRTSGSAHRPQRTTSILYRYHSKVVFALFLHINCTLTAVLRRWESKTHQSVFPTHHKDGPRRSQRNLLDWCERGHCRRQNLHSAGPISQRRPLIGPKPRQHGHAYLFSRQAAPQQAPVLHPCVKLWHCGVRVGLTTAHRSLEVSKR